MANLSDGEVVSSEDEGTCKIKTPKLEETSEETIICSIDHENQSVGGSDDDEGWELVQRGPRKRKGSAVKENKKKKKKRKRAPEIKEEITSPRSFLQSEQRDLLHCLCKLVGAVSDGVCPKFKTSDLQAVICHLVLNEPGISKKAKMKRAKQLRDKKMVVIWLSNISKSDFCSSEKHFSKLKAIMPQVQFSILHPGSEKFVKFGLETLMEIEEPMELPAKYKIPAYKIPATTFSRAHCLLNKNELELHEYAVPNAARSSDRSDNCDEETSKTGLHPGYFTLTDWPSNHCFEEEVASYPMFSVDCEMVETGEGETLARVSIVNEELKSIYDELVKPPEPVLNYRTQFSGIAESMLVDVTTTLDTVQENLRQILPAKCILIGQSLENDLKVLKLCHPYIIDTALLFTPHATPRSKPGLKFIAKKILDKDIQSGYGHNSTEDAAACMELVLRKLKEGPELLLSWKDTNKKSLLSHLSLHGVCTGMVDKPSLAYHFGRGLEEVQCVTTDEDAVDRACESMIDTKFLFVQLHSMELYLKQDEQNEQKFQKVIDTLDSYVCDIIGSSPQGTLVFAICGSSYIGEVRKLQKNSRCDPNTLRCEVEKARSGHVVAILK